MNLQWAETATRWQRLAERRREHLLSISERGHGTFDNAKLTALISATECDIARWAALAEGRYDDPTVPKLDLGLLRGLMRPPVGAELQEPVLASGGSKGDAHVSEQGRYGNPSIPESDPQHLQVSLPPEPVGAPSGSISSDAVSEKGRDDDLPVPDAQPNDLQAPLSAELHEPVVAPGGSDGSADFSQERRHDDPSAPKFDPPHLQAPPPVEIQEPLVAPGGSKGDAQVSGEGRHDDPSIPALESDDRAVEKGEVRDSSHDPLEELARFLDELETPALGAERG
jgi:hypothetical protein